MFCLYNVPAEIIKSGSNSKKLWEVDLWAISYIYIYIYAYLYVCVYTYILWKRKRLIQKKKGKEI